jgi:hypothetical protein
MRVCGSGRIIAVVTAGSPPPSTCALCGGTRTSKPAPVEFPVGLFRSPEPASILDSRWAHLSCLEAVPFGTDALVRLSRYRHRQFTDDPGDREDFLRFGIGTPGSVSRWWTVQLASIFVGIPLFIVAAALRGHTVLAWAVGVPGCLIVVWAASWLVQRSYLYLKARWRVTDDDLEHPS